MAFSKLKWFTRVTAYGLFLACVSSALAACGTLQVSVDVQVPGTPTPTPVMLPGDVFADSIVLLGYSASSLEVSADSEWPLRLHWEVKATPLCPYTLDFRLKDSDGKLAWSYGDDTISWTSGRFVTDHRLPLSKYLDEGYYGLEVMLWDPVGRVRAPATGPGGPRQDNIVPVARIYVKGGTAMDLIRSSPPANIPVVTAVFTATVVP